MHFVGRVDWAFADSRSPDSPISSGLARRVLIGPEQGAVHTELAIGALAPAGWLARHVHSFEEALYVLEGELVLELDGKVRLLVAGDYALIQIGTPHTLLAGPAGAAVRWLSVNTPPRRPPGAQMPDTIFAATAPSRDALLEAAERPVLGTPLTRFVGHYEGTPPQLEALKLADSARGRAPVGMDSALIAYSGISVKMLIDRPLGAELLTMFTVDYELGGAAQAHDHPFEETYFFLAGEVEAELDWKPYTLRAGDVVFAGVGSVHGFWNVGTERVRWIETQAPQPPGRHAYRWERSWKGVAERGVEPWPNAGGSVARPG